MQKRKVLNFPQSRLSESELIGRLKAPLDVVYALATSHIATLFGEVFRGIDASLFELARRAPSNQVQSEYFEGMREIRTRRQAADRVIRQGMLENFSDLINGRMSVSAPDPTTHSGKLALLNLSMLDESLAVSSASNKAEVKLAWPLYAMNTRFNALLSGAQIDNATNPIGPRQLSELCRQAIAGFEVTLRVRLVTYKLFERLAVPALEVLYDEVNTRLISAGVLPDLRFQVSNGTRFLDATPSHNGHAPGGSNNGEPPASADEIFHLLRSLISAQSPSATASTGADADDAGTLTQADLIAALQALQAQVTQARTHASTATSAVHTETFKRALLQQAQQVVPGNTGIARIDQDSCDLVGMLFEIIIEDRKLPVEVKALLGRLQIPFLKAAISDRQIYSRRKHPARRLLDNMSQSCVDYGDESGEIPEILFAKIKEGVEAVLHDYQDDIQVIERVNDEFERYLHSETQRAELAEARAAERLYGQDRLKHAQRVVTVELRERCEGKALPYLFRKLIDSSLRQYLALHLLRYGEASKEWRHTLALATTFIWSAAPMKTRADAQRLVALGAALRLFLRQSLGDVAWHEDEITRLLIEIEMHYAKQAASMGVLIIPTPPSSASAHEMVSTVPELEAPCPELPPEALAPPLPAERFHTDEELAIAPPSIDAKQHALLLDHVKNLPIGSWFEFKGAGSTSTRGKLSWVSPISRKCLFVDRKGLTVAVKTQHDLVLDINNGLACKLEQEQKPMFDRALSTLMNKLRPAERQAG